MPPRPALPPGPYLVVGLARSGSAIARVLAGLGDVIGCDSGEPAEAAQVEGIELHLRSDGVELLDRVRTVVKSPGVPREVPVIAEALARGLDVTGELELAWRLLENRFIAVTGTNGKTTTVELIGAIHRQAGLPVAVAGNVGTPLASLVGAIDGEATVVCEASSFQLEDSSHFHPEVAVLLNIEPDHLDRHHDLGAYREAKLRIFANQDADDYAVVPAALGASGSARPLTFGWDGESDVSAVGGELVFRGQRLVRIDELSLRGAHNVENSMAAAAAALADGSLRPEPVVDALRAFPGVPHRLEEVARVGGVLYVNDSKAPNGASAVRGIEAFEGGVHAILGGSLKGGGFEGLRDTVAARCSAAYLIGEAEQRLAADLDGTVPLRRCGTLATAVAEASATARPGEVVLLSPACASFDSFRDYEQRGEHFRALVAEPA